MFKEISEIAPQGLLIGVILWALFSYGISSDLIAGRIAQVDVIPQCEQHIIDDVEADFNTQLATITQPTDVENTATAWNNSMDGLNNTLRQLYPDHAPDDPTAMAFNSGPPTMNPMQAFDLLSGGSLSTTQHMLESAAQQAQAAREQAQIILRQQADAAINSAPSVCQCQTQAAFEEDRLDWAIYTATLGIFEPASVANFATQAAAKRGMCRERDPS